AGQNAVSLPAMFLAACLGGVLGAAGAFLLGRRYGMTVIRRFTGQSRPKKGGDEEVRALFRRFGERALMLNRFLWVIRGVVLYGAGAFNLHFGRAMVWTTIGNVLWVSLLMVAGLVTADNWDAAVANYERLAILFGGIALVVLLVGLVWIVWRGRAAKRSD
ncbi:MAG: VTT domain-containing protein, partial [Acidobacteriota bacterium]